MRSAGRVEQRGWPLLLLEVAAFVLVFWADAQGHVPLSKTPFLFLIAWASLRSRGMRWRDVGLALPAGWMRLVALGCAAGVAFWVFEYFVENPLLHALTGRYPDLSDFRDVVGNAPLLLILLGLNIVLAGFGEEMVWRGYALSRVALAVGRPAHRFEAEQVQQRIDLQGR